MTAPSQDEESQDRLSTVFEILQSERRVRCLKLLHTGMNGETVANLAVGLTYADLFEIDVQNLDVSAEEFVETRRKRFFVSLYQTHVPFMAEFGLLTHSEDGTVEIADAELMDDLTSVLDILLETVDAEPFSGTSLGLIPDILSMERRRITVRLLDERGETTLQDIAAPIAAHENQIEQSAVTDDQRKRVYVGMYQVHLPKMKDKAIVEWDQDTGRLAPGDAFGPVAELLEQSEAIISVS